MATLNVKHLPDALYRKLKARAKREHRSVAQEVVVLLEQALEPPAALSISSCADLARSYGGTAMPAPMLRVSGPGGADRRSRPSDRLASIPQHGRPAETSHLID